MGLDIAIYLLREGTDLDGSVLNDKIGAEYEEVTTHEEADFDIPHVCYVRKTEPKKAKWTAWLEPVFNFGNATPKNQSSGCVVVIEAEERLFALAFGTGRFGLDPACIEYDFGLRVALNKVHPDKLRQLVSKTVDIRTREKSTYHHAGGSIGDFAMDLDVEWLRSIAGTAASEDQFAAVAGTDAIRLQNYKKPLTSIESLCKDLMEAYEEDIPEAFAFADNVRPIASKDPLHQTLEDAFSAKVDSGDRGGLEIIVDWGVVDKMGTARLFFGREERELSDLSGDAVWAAADELLSTVDDLVPSKIKLDILDDAGDQITRSSLLSVLQVEFEYNNKTYLRLERRWFEVADDYIKQVDQRVQDLPDFTADLALPDWDKAAHPDELDYNTDVATKKAWLLQDQVFIYPSGGGGAKFEPCDILTEEAHWVHVKEGVSSSCLNHLFGQISVAAELYARHEDSRTEMQARYAAKWAATPLTDRRSTFVAAIGRAKVKKDLLGRMLVAKINLLDHARRVRALDYDFAVAGFKVVPDPAKKAKPKPKKAKPKKEPAPPKVKAKKKAPPPPKPKTS